MKKGFRQDSAEPLYEQVIRKIKADISEGVYSVGDRIPSEMELCELYGVSRITVRKALEIMNKNGVLARKQGKGTFVSEPGNARELRQISSFHTACEEVGKKASTRVIYARTAPVEEQDRIELNLPKNCRIVETCRVQLADGVPVMLEINRFPMAYSYLLDCDLNGSLYNLLNGYGIEPKQAMHDISLVKADTTHASALNVETGTPLLYLHEVIFDQKGRPLHTSRQYIRGDKFTLRL